MKLSRGYRPRSYKGRVNWYVSDPRAHAPVHLFSTKAEAMEWASQQPPVIIHGVDMVCPLDWFPADSNPRDTVTSSRQLIDHRHPQQA